MAEEINRPTYKDIIGDSPNADRDIALLCLSLMPEQEREKQLKLHPELKDAWEKIVKQTRSK